MSPSPRRAWIEMLGTAYGYGQTHSRPPHGGRGLKSRIDKSEERRLLSPSPRRAWIEIAKLSPVSGTMARRPPHGGRGLKFDRLGLVDISFGRPPHGGRGLKWKCMTKSNNSRGRPPHGGRGLKYFFKVVYNFLSRRPPHGGRGLKFALPPAWVYSTPSPSPRRAWIEIAEARERQELVDAALPTEGVD